MLHHTIPFLGTLVVGSDLEVLGPEHLLSVVKEIVIYCCCVWVCVVHGV